jgi:hypothetical protein
MNRAQYLRRTAGVAALLPALLLAALYVAAPFAGTTTHAIADQTSLARTLPLIPHPVAGQNRAFQ